MSKISTIRAVEEASLNGWPAHQTLVKRGWLMRFAQGYTRRANSVNPIYWANGSVNQKELATQVTACEAHYRQQGLPAIFKISPVVQPEGLDQFLAQRGYNQEAPTGVMVRPLIAPPAHEKSSVSFTVEATLDEAWLERFAHFNQTPAHHLDPMAKVLRNILPKRGFATLWHEGHPVACGLGVVEEHLVGVFDIVTAEAHRGKGHGTQLLYHLLEWGKKQGASMAYLQVMDSNAPARNLYAKLGFNELYSYWYRVKR
jgi:GNAT superfamily N-acetyltransferase